MAIKGIILSNNAKGITYKVQSYYIWEILCGLFQYAFSDFPGVWAVDAGQFLKFLK